MYVKPDRYTRLEPGWTAMPLMHASMAPRVHVLEREAALLLPATTEDIYVIGTSIRFRLGNNTVLD